MTFPITPPPELVDQWVAEACPECRLTYDEFTGESVQSLATIAARWGADQELEACCHLIETQYDSGSRHRSARRPKPPTLKEQALEELEEIMTELHNETGSAFTASNIRRAIEALPE